ncbi:hypothetical protein H4582DRAFT_2131218 [Lactarius indigo]|nr:hypothetical protein H4582DRAFT_2131218 [Lactarius indigo]
MHVSLPSCNRYRRIVQDFSIFTSTYETYVLRIPKRDWDDADNSGRGRTELAEHFSTSIFPPQQGLRKKRRVGLERWVKIVHYGARSIALFGGLTSAYHPHSNRRREGPWDAPAGRLTPQKFDVNGFNSAHLFQVNGHTPEGLREPGCEGAEKGLAHQPDVDVASSLLRRSALELGYGQHEFVLMCFMSPPLRLRRAYPEVRLGRGCAELVSAKSFRKPYNHKLGDTRKTKWRTEGEGKLLEIGDTNRDKCTQTLPYISRVESVPRGFSSITVNVSLPARRVRTVALASFITLSSPGPIYDSICV